MLITALIRRPLGKNVLAMSFGMFLNTFCRRFTIKAILLRIIDFYVGKVFGEYNRIKRPYVKCIQLPLSLPYLSLPPKLILQTWRNYICYRDVVWSPLGTRCGHFCSLTLLRDRAHCLLKANKHKNKFCPQPKCVHSEERERNSITVKLI